MNANQFLSRVKDTQREFIENHSTDPIREMLQHHYKAEGKLLRPLFGYQLANAISLDPAKIVEWCSASEMLHNATLIHDDLQDGDKTRRGEISLWYKFSGNQAINAGDFLMMLAPKIIINANLSSDIKVQLLDLFSSFSSRIVQGQSIEFEIRNHLSDPGLKQLYEKCIEYKTSELFSGLARGVGIISGIETKKIEDIYSTFKELGIIFQYQDDILDLYGDKNRDEIGCDIKEGKISCLVVEYLNMFPKDEHNILSTILKDREKTSSEEVTYIISTFRETGVLDQALANIAKKIALIRELDLTQSNSDYSRLILGTILKVLQPIQHLEEDQIRSNLWNV